MGWGFQGRGAALNSPGVPSSTCGLRIAGARERDELGGGGADESGSGTS
jgi:hypothetical protein